MSKRSPLHEAASWGSDEQPIPEPPNGNRSQGTSFNLEEFIAAHVTVKRGPIAWDTRGRKWELSVCPFNSDHSGCAVITQGHDGKLGFKCQHNSCSDNHWKQVREKFDGPRLHAFAQANAGEKKASANGHQPTVFNVADLLALDVPKSEMLIETLLPKRGAVLLVGAAKSGKTLLAAQAAIAIASGNALFDNYQILEAGPALLLEQDDPAGAGSVKEILERSRVPVKGIPFYLAPRVPFGFGPELLSWLERQISARSLRLVVLDSYTALRSSRGASVDIVKAEQCELNLLDDLAKRTNCTILIVHHGSKGAAGMDWTDQAAGSFAMSAGALSSRSYSRHTGTS